MMYEKKSALHPLSLRITAIICSEGATITSPSLKGKGDRVSGGRVSPSGLSDTTVGVSLKQEDEKAQDYSLRHGYTAPPPSRMEVRVTIGRA